MDDDRALFRALSMDVDIAARTSLGRRPIRGPAFLPTFGQCPFSVPIARLPAELTGDFHRFAGAPSLALELHYQYRFTIRLPNHALKKS
jgi:hypothetical protein